MIAARTLRRPVSARAVLAPAALVLPPVLVVWLLANPGLNPNVVLPTEHFFIVTVVAMLAVLVALLVTRSALQMAQYQVLLIALGFMCVAGFFSVHALATPGILLGRATGYGYDSLAAPMGQAGHAMDAMATYDYSGTVVGVSGFLSIFIPSFFFAAAFTPLAEMIRRRISFSLGSALVLATAAMLLGYGFLAGWQSDLVAGLPVSQPPYSYGVAGTAALLLGFAAWKQGQQYRRTRFPMHGALVLSFVYLAQAEITMVVAPAWSVVWWGYHAQMFVGVTLALGALFVELDRRRGLERFLPYEVVERVVTGDALRLQGERRVVTVLFADLRGSTALAEQMPAEAVVELLNLYVGALARCVFAERGMLDKFLGDGLMAVFGVLDDGTNGAAAAARAAVAMRQAIREINDERTRQGRPVVQFGVGAHTGEVVLGAIGIPQRSDYTAIGDTVNTAARLESLCKEYGVDIVLSQAVADRLPAGTLEPRSLGETAVRGKREPLLVYTLA